MAKADEKIEKKNRKKDKKRDDTKNRIAVLRIKENKEKNEMLLKLKINKSSDIRNFDVNSLATNFPRYFPWVKPTHRPDRSPEEKAELVETLRSHPEKFTFHDAVYRGPARAPGQISLPGFDARGRASLQRMKDAEIARWKKKQQKKKSAVSTGKKQKNRSSKKQKSEKLD